MKTELLEASYMNNFCKKSFFRRSIVFEISSFEVPLLTTLEVQNRGKLQSLKLLAFHRNTCWLWNFYTIFYYILGMFFVKKSFWRTVLCREIKNKNLNFREFRQIMGQFWAENDIFIFRARHVRPSFPRLSLECLQLIYECFMFLEFWLKLFIKIAPDKNVFFSLNSR